MAYEILNPARSGPVRGVLFDMDGLVLDTERLYTRFWIEATRAAGYPMTQEQALGIRSLNQAHGQRYLESCFGPGISYQTLREDRIRRMNAWTRTHCISPKPGIRALLACLHSHGIPCAITSSSPLDRVEAYLKPLGLYDQFDQLCSGYEVPHGKPDPDIYLYGASRIQVPPENCLALEDSPAGIASACGAGCMPVVIPDLDEPSAETLSRCFARADSLADICALLQRLNG